MAGLFLLSLKRAGGRLHFCLGACEPGWLTSLACSGGVSHLLSSSDSPLPPATREALLLSSQEGHGQSGKTVSHVPRPLGPLPPLLLLCPSCILSPVPVASGTTLGFATSDSCGQIQWPLCPLFTVKHRCPVLTAGVSPPPPPHLRPLSWGGL